MCGCSRLQKRLGEIAEQVVQINKEEELFQWTPTTYPQLESIQGSLEPYQKLFATIFKWQRTEKRLMDGTLLELNAEDTQAEVHILYSRWTLGLLKHPQNLLGS